MNRTLYVFDFDGTLFNSCPRIHRTISKIFQISGITPPSLAEFLLELRAPYIDFYRRRGVKLTDAEIEEIFREHGNREKAELFLDVVPTISRLAREGCTLAIVSGNRSGVVEDELRKAGIRHLFAEIRIGCEDKVSAIQGIVARLGFKPEEAIMVGDSALDIEHAWEAGVRPIGIIRHPELECLRSELILLGAERCISSIQELDENKPDPAAAMA